MDKLIITTMTALSLFALNSCDDASVVDNNLTKASDNFKVTRRVVFYNGITGEYILTIEGLLAIQDANGQLEVLVKTSPTEFKKHFLGLSDNVTYFCEQIKPNETDTHHYRVVFKPSVVVPDMEMR